ncbi:MAG: UDP-N-acetylmuramoyl-L-alanyl-D-glutamate--2,6-diaminopimelate ligase [bacterium]|nr:UDP-N-acetylmuramoyl-L-alanyl-D-glutamate--2,6-diaminopimelate ligase [bacterium]
MSATAMMESVRQFEELIREVPEVSARSGGGAEVSGIAYDSRRVKPGDLFVAIRGFESDGHDYVQAALSAGAAALVLEREVPGVPGKVPRAVTASGRKALAALADAFYGHPSGELALVGVTGTNGKTTAAFLIETILRNAGRRTGLMGTIHYRIGDRVFEGPRTTPEAPDLQGYLREMAEGGTTHAVMEVSSHAIALDRVSGCAFAAAVFTNLTQDHLDFHGDIESYFREKLRLFTEWSPGTAVVNLDDPYGVRISAETKSTLMTYGTGGSGDVRAEELAVSPEGMVFSLVHPGGRVPIRTGLIGRHNVQNILAAGAACLALGLSAAEVAEGVRALPNVPGRFERVDAGQPFLVVVDYAHTEDALARVLEFARPLTKGRVLTLMGCGGDRDRSKRPLMAAAALRGSDFVYMTSDNPRTEDPEAILREVEAGARQVVDGTARCRSVVDRREAIGAILADAEPGDVVIIAGKGHESYQIVGRERRPFDDREEARAALRRMGFGR